MARSVQEPTSGFDARCVASVLPTRTGCSPPPISVATTAPRDAWGLGGQSPYAFHDVWVGGTPIMEVRRIHAEITGKGGR